MRFEFQLSLDALTAYCNIFSVLVYCFAANGRGSSDKSEGAFKQSNGETCGAYRNRESRRFTAKGLTDCSDNFFESVEMAVGKIIYFPRRVWVLHSQQGSV